MWFWGKRSHLCLVSCPTERFNVIERDMRWEFSLSLSQLFDRLYLGIVFISYFGKRETNPFVNAVFLMSAGSVGGQICSSAATHHPRPMCKCVCEYELFSFMWNYAVKWEDVLYIFYITYTTLSNVGGWESIKRDNCVFCEIKLKGQYLFIHLFG